jgi:hypothetical protein
MADECTKLTEEANAIVTKMRATPTNDEYLFELAQYRKDLNETIRLIMAGDVKTGLWHWVNGEIDGLFSERLIDMPHKGDEFNLTKWPANDAAVYRAHKQITQIVNLIAAACTPGKRAAPAGNGAAARNVVGSAARAGNGAAARNVAGRAAPAGNGAATRNVRTNARRAANNGNRNTRNNANAARRRMQNERNALAFLKGNNSLF